MVPVSPGRQGRITVDGNKRAIVIRIGPEHLPVPEWEMAFSFDGSGTRSF